MKIKNVIILAGLLSFAQTGFSQCAPVVPCTIVQNGDFTSFPGAVPLAGSNMTVANSCYWEPAFGSPMYSATAVSPLRAAYMWSVSDNGESIMQDFTPPQVIQAGVSYYLSYQRRMLPNIAGDPDLLDNYFIRLTQSGSSGLPIAGTAIPAVPATSQLIGGEALVATSGAYVFREFCFTSNNNYDQVYIYPHEASGNQKWLLIDDVFLARLADAGPDHDPSCGPVTLGPACIIPGATYAWTSSPFDPTLVPTVSNPVVNPTVPTSYTLTVTSPGGTCNATDVVIVTPGTWQQTSSLTTGSEKGKDVTTDAAGNVYVTGDISNTSTFGSGSSTLTIPASGMYVAKYDPCGNLLWIAYTKNGTANGKGIIVNSVDGQVIVTGEINSSTAVGTEDFVHAHTNVATTCTPGTVAGSVGLDKTTYLAKYDMNTGCLLDVAGYGNSVSNIIKYQSVDCTPGTGYGLFVCGYKQTNPTTKQAMIAKHTSGAGIPMSWQVISGGTSGFNRIANDIDYQGGPIYVTGTFSRDMTWGSLTLAITATTDAFVYKFNNAALPPPASFARKGNVIAPGLATGNSITVDPAGDVYVTGKFTNGFSAAFSGPALAASSSLPEAYICKITPAGACSWAQRIFSTTAVAGSGISADATHVYVTGNFYGQYITLPSGTSIVSNQIPSSPSLTNYFVTKLASGTGTDVWGNLSEGLNQHISNGIRVHGGFAYTTGGYLGTMHLPPYFAAPMGQLVQTGAGMNAFVNRNDGLTGTFRQQENEQSVPAETAETTLQLKAFPNPGDGLFTLETVGEITTDVLTIAVYNSFGQLVLSKQANSSEHRYLIDLRSYDKGMYFIRINTGTETAHTRVLTR